MVTRIAAVSVPLAADQKGGDHHGGAMKDRHSKIVAMLKDCVQLGREAEKVLEQWYSQQSNQPK